MCIRDSPAILAVAGLMTLVEFIADKAPWFDSLWDTVHTVIRPVGGAILGVSALGHLDPLVTVLAGLFCGSISLSSHLTKAGSRLLVNTSPEPVSNSIASLIEDGIVLGGLYLTYHHPLVLLAVLLILFALFLWLAPLLFRHIHLTGYFILRKLRSLGLPADLSLELPRLISLEARHRLEKDLAGGESLEWAVPVVTGKIQGLPGNCKGYLCRLLPDGRLAVATGKRAPVFFDTDNTEINSSYRTLYDELSLFNARRRRGQSVRFAKNHRAYFEAVKKALTK